MGTSVKNYYQISKIEIDKIIRNKTRPTLALHACCAPCSTFPLEFLTPYFDVTIIYTNSNIYPSSEYYRRINELKRYLSIFNEKNASSVSLVEFEYNNDEYNKHLEPFKEQKEGQDRCKLCYSLRINEAYRYADEHNFDYFTTVMTISRQKNSQILNEIGKNLSQKYKTKYFYSDFKKKKGIDRSWEIRKQYNMYIQEYCGCKYSYEAYLKKEKNSYLFYK